MDYDNFLELVKNRRSIRRFKPDPIPDEYIEKIIEAARWAPSGYNSQPWDFVVVKDKQLRDRILQPIDMHKNLIGGAQAAGNEERLRILAHPWLDEEVDLRIAPALIILLGDVRTKAGLPHMGKIQPERVKLNINSGLACAFVYMHLAATTLGLAAQWVGVMPDTCELLIKLLDMPEELEPYMLMPVGYPAYKPRPKLLRPKEKMVHYDYCGKADFRTDGEVNEFARRTWIWNTANHRRGTDKGKNV